MRIVTDSAQVRAVVTNPLFKRMMDAGGGPNSTLPYFMNDAAVSGGWAFLVAELEKRELKLHEPLASLIWPRDINANLGGGWIEFTSLEFASYAISGPNQYGLTGNSTSLVPVIQANVSKDIYPVFIWQNNMETTYGDLQKAQYVGRSIERMYDTGIKLNYQKSVELIVYQGWVGNPGLLNNSNIAAASAALGASTFTAWNTKTPAEIVYDINAAMVATWAASQYDLSGMATHILIPPAQYTYIATQTMSSNSQVSILTYLMENNIARNQGLTMQIHPARWCIGAGQGGTDRMFCYVNDKDKVEFDLPVPLTRVMTVPSITQGVTYQTSFMAQIGVVKVLYLQTQIYVDGI